MPKVTSLLMALSIFLAAFTVRYIYGVLIVGPTAWSDSQLFLDHAEAVRLGQSYGIPDRPPLFPYVVAGITTLTGEVKLSVTLYQITISALTCVLIYGIGRRLFSESVGQLASWVSVIYYPFINSARLIDSDTQFPFLLTLTAYSLLKAQSITHYVVSGAVFGLACLTRGAGLFALPFILLCWFLASCESNKQERTQQWGGAAIFTVVTFLMLAPWTIRNWVDYGAIIPVSSEGAYNFYQGAHAEFLESRSVNRALLAEVTGDPSINGDTAIQPQHQNALWSHVSSLWITAPTTQLLLRLISFADFWSPIERVRFYTIGISTLYSWAMYAIVLVCFGLGLLELLWERHSQSFFLLGSIFGVTTLHTLSHAEQSRYRLQIEPFILVIAMYGLERAIHRYAKKGS